MESTSLGTSGLTVSRLGFGGCPLGGHGWGAMDVAEAEAAVRRAAELGINFFDTADVYGLGHSEETLARVLGSRRHELVIASKFGVCWDASGRTWKDISPTRLKVALDASLKRLRLEAIPLYYVHWPDGQTPIEETMDALDRCRRAGKIRAIGLSNFGPAEIERAVQIAPVSALQVQYSLVDRHLVAELGQVIQRHQIPLVTWGSLAQGLLSGKYDASSRFGADDRRHRYENFQGDKFAENLRAVAVLKTIAARCNRTPAQVAIRWLLDAGGVGSVLFGAKRPLQVDDNCGALDWQLSAEDCRALTELDQPSVERAAG